MSLHKENWIHRELKKKLPKSRQDFWKILKEQLIGLGKGLAFYGVIIAILYFCEVLVLRTYFLNSWMKTETAIEMLKAVVALDGVLIGFIGIIGVYGLGEISRTVEKAQQVPLAWSRHKDAIEGWQTSFLYLLSLTVLVLAASVLFSLQSMSYTTSCQIADNQLRCFVPEYAPNAFFRFPLDALFLGMAGIVWVIRSLRNPLKNK